ncbi:MAG: HupE/UreJ family protein [Comamonas sp.]
MKTKQLFSALLATSGALPLSALAHVGTDGGGHHNFLDSFTHAIAHPFGGTDHLAAMLAVGVWSALAFGKSGKAWAAPAGFVALLVAGCLAGFAGLQVPAVEPMIAASVLVMGLLVMVQQKMAVGAAAGLTGLFAFFHGAAHGYELFEEAFAPAAGVIVGMAAGSALLHFAGMVVGHRVMQRFQTIAKVAGGLTAALGAFMLTRLA